MVLDKINLLVNQFGIDVIKQMQEELKKNKSISSNKLINSLNYKAKVQIEKIIIQFNAEDYAIYIEQGRKAGTRPPVSKLKEWCKIRGIKEENTFKISNKIFKFGIKPKPFLMKSLEKQKQAFVVSLLKLFGQEIIADVKLTFLEELKKK